jgi:hypothetical protein
VGVEFVASPRSTLHYSDHRTNCYEDQLSRLTEWGQSLGALVGRQKSRNAVACILIMLTSLSLVSCRREMSSDDLAEKLRGLHPVLQTAGRTREVQCQRGRQGSVCRVVTTTGVLTCYPLYVPDENLDGFRCVGRLRGRVVSGYVAVDDQ